MYALVVTRQVVPGIAGAQQVTAHETLASVLGVAEEVLGAGYSRDVRRVTISHPNWGAVTVDQARRMADGTLSEREPPWSQ